MPVYKSFTEAIKDLAIPLDRVGEMMVKDIKTVITENWSMGEPLSPKWTAKKTQNQNTKLLHTGEMRDSTRYSLDKHSVSIGYDGKGSNHKPDKGSGVMTNAGMAQVHNEGNSKGLYRIPKRPFLFDNGEWLSKHKNAIETFIKNYYQNKGIL